MLYLVTGGSGSGKSEYAEHAAVQAFRALCGEGPDRQEAGLKTDEDGAGGKADLAGSLFYVATMKPYDEECRERIARHRRMRRGKGFETLECPCRIETLKGSGQDVFLLEDLSNLLANEQYLEEGRIKGKGEEARQQAAEAVLQPILKLAHLAGCMVIVTNEIFSDGTRYDEETEEYRRLLGFLNRELAGAADGVAEVVCGIPLCQKGELPC